MPELLANIDVDDLPCATAFYTAALGLRVGRRLGTFGVELLGAALPLFLLAKPPGSLPFGGATVGRSYARHWTPVHLDFAVDDLDDAVATACAAGARLEGEPSQHAFGRMATLADPFGHGLCLIEFNARGYDALVES
jgi:predicted enzyme related to lactoylglutathione lyase